MLFSHNADMEAVRRSEKYLMATLICAGVAIVDGYDITSLAFAVPLLTKQWGYDPAAFTAALTSGSLGMLVGALACGVLADRYGRKAVLMGCVALFGVASALTVLVASPGQLTFARTITGLGLGGGVPVAIALVTDISPRSRQSGLVMLMSVGMAVGGLAGGYLVSTFLIGPYGWKSIFLLGGIAPLLYLPALLFLPGSARTDMAAAGKDDFIDIIGSLLRDGYAAITLTLWGIVALNFLVIYLIVSWLPSILHASGAAPQQAILGAVMFQAGGIVSTLGFGLIIDRIQLKCGLIVMFTNGIAAVLAIGTSPLSFVEVVGLTFVCGVGFVAGQKALNGLVGTAYPAEMRSTGAGWALGIGRVGTIGGPLLGGILFALELSPKQILMSAALPACIMVLLVLALYRMTKAPVAVIATSNLRP